MKSTKRLLVIAALVLAPALATASEKGGLFIEPGVTYQLLDTTVNWGSPLNDSTGKNNGLGLSARLGFHINEAFFAGIDGRYAFTKFEDSAFDTQSDAKSYNLAPVVGIQMPNVGLRIWGAYVLMAEVDPDKVTKTAIDYDPKLAKGTGYRIGAGFHVAMVSLNLEYQDLKYDDVSAATSLGTVSPNSATSKGFIAGVSFPFEL